VPHDETEDAEAAARHHLHELFQELQATRLGLPLSQRRLSAQLGLNEFVVRRWETGIDLPYTGNFVRWAHALGHNVSLLDPAGPLTAPSPQPRRSEAPELYEFRRIATALRTLRTEADLTQKELAELLLISGWTMSMWELAQRQPRILHLIKWADALGCRLALTKL
jgi:transcriptional regulator with XRE-family HTH domain